MQNIASHGWAMARRGDIRVGDVLVPPLAKLRAVEVSGRANGAAEKFVKGMPEPRGGSGPLWVIRRRR